MNENKTELTPIQKKLREILTESTGGNIVDSGGAYGRHWSRNQKNPPWEKPPVSYEASRNPDGRTYFDFTVNVYHYFTEPFVLDERMEKVFDRYTRLFPADESWDEMLEKFMPLVAAHRNRNDGTRSSADVKVISWYTYNEPDSWFLSQDFVGHAVQNDFYDDGQVWAVRIHQGCDARWGFSRPFFVRPKGESVQTRVTVLFRPDANEPEDQLIFDWLGEWVDYEGSGGGEEFQTALNACEINTEGRLTFEGKPIEVYGEFNN